MTFDLLQKEMSNKDRDSLDDSIRKILQLVDLVQNHEAPVALRDFVEVNNGTVTWNPLNKTASVTIGSKTVTYNGTIDNIIDGRIYISPIDLELDFGKYELVIFPDSNIKNFVSSAVTNWLLTNDYTNNDSVNQHIELNNGYTNNIVEIGSISAKYETGGFHPDAVSSGKGDYGGILYGVPQFSTTTGSADAFISWIKSNYPDMGEYFNDYKAGTEEFSSAWKKLLKFMEMNLVIYKLHTSTTLL